MFRANQTEELIKLFFTAISCYVANSYDRIVIVWLTLLINYRIMVCIHLFKKITIVFSFVLKDKMFCIFVLLALFC